MSDLRATATAIAEEMQARPDVLAVLLTGSVARGDATSSSDVDLVVVTSEDVVEGARALRREFRGGVLVESVSRSPSEWRHRLHRPVPRWVYAFIEGDILYDRGVGAQLVGEAREVRANYATPIAVLEEMAAAFRHGQAKLDRARASVDPAIRGYQASVAVDWIIDALYALHNVPLPAAAQRLHYLEDVPLDADTRGDFESLLTGDVDERISANSRLQASIRDRLPEPRTDLI